MLCGDEVRHCFGGECSCVELLFFILLRSLEDLLELRICHSIVFLLVIDPLHIGLLLGGLAALLRLGLLYLLNLLLLLLLLLFRLLGLGHLWSPFPSSG